MVITFLQKFVRIVSFKCPQAGSKKCHTYILLFNFAYVKYLTYIHQNSFSRETTTALPITVDPSVHTL